MYSIAGVKNHATLHIEYLSAHINFYPIVALFIFLRFRFDLLLTEFILQRILLLSYQRTNNAIKETTERDIYNFRFLIQLELVLLCYPLVHFPYVNFTITVYLYTLIKYWGETFFYKLGNFFKSYCR